MTKTQTFFIFFILALIASVSIQAQGISLSSIAQKHIDYQHKGMMVLGGWGLSNAIIGGIGMSHTSGETKYFHQMNLGWGVINAGIAALGFFTTKDVNAYYDVQTLLSDHHSIKNVLLFNGGLDVGYMLGGLYLMEKSKNETKNPLRLKGFGKSILLQGAFLFAFDLGSYFMHNSLTKDIHNQVSFHSSGDSMGLIYRF